MTSTCTYSAETFCRLTRCHFCMPAPESHCSVTMLRRHKLHIARFPCKHEKSAHSVDPPLPKKSSTFRGPQSIEVIAQSYSHRTAIQLSKNKHPLTHYQWERLFFRVFEKYFLSFRLFPPGKAICTPVFKKISLHLYSHFGSRNYALTFYPPILGC